MDGARIIEIAEGVNPRIRDDIYDQDLIDVAHAIRREALEEAARVCEEYAAAYEANPVGGLAPGRIAGAEDCAGEIRYLIDAKPEQSE